MINTSAQTALKNSIYNLIGFIIPIILMIVTTPIIISRWGAKEYGVYLFLNTIVVFLGLLDLGVSTATSKHIIEYRSTGQEDRLKKLIYSMNSVYLLMAFIYLITCISIGFIIQTLFIERVGLGNNNYILIFFILGITIFISTFFANFSNSFTTIQRYDLQTKINLVLIILSNISMVILVTLGYGIISVLLIQMSLTLLVNIIYYVTINRVFPLMQLKYMWIKKEIIKNYKFGLSVAFNNLANSSLVHFDKLLIPIFLGNAQLTYYGVPGSIATKIPSISGTFSSLLFPITVNLQATNNTEKISKIYVRSIRLIALTSSAIAFSIIFTADKILLFWLGNDFAEKTTLTLILLVLTNLFLSLLSPLANLLTAMNKMKFLTTGSLAMASINIISLFILLPRYGINGAASAYLISVLLVIPIFYYAEKYYLNIHKSIHIKLVLKILFTITPFFFIVKFLLYPMIKSLSSLILIETLSILIFMILYKSFGFIETEDWNDLKKFFKKIS